MFKVNPPLRTADDVAALRAALADGTIDTVATDHAPHPHEDKDCEWAAAAIRACSASRPRCRSCRRRWSRPGCSTGPASPTGCPPARPRIGRLAGHGRPLAVGAPANLVLVDPAARREIDPFALASRSRNTPYAGRTLPGAVVATFLRGRPTVLDGKLQ